MRVIGMRGVIGVLGVRLLGLLGLLELLGLLGPAVADVALVAALVVTALAALVGAGGPGLVVADVLVVALGRADVLAVRLGAVMAPVLHGWHGHGGRCLELGLRGRWRRAMRRRGAVARCLAAGGRRLPV